MTIQKAINNIYSYFAQNSNIFVLDLNEIDTVRKINKTNLVISDLSAPVLQSIYILAAQDLEKLNFLRKIKDNIWVLNSEISQMSQNIEISGGIADLLARVNNELAIKTNLEHRTNPMKLNESDLSFLVVYVSELLLNKDNKAE